MKLLQLEKKLQELIYPDLLRGREAFDLPHTKAVVYWMKQILKTEPNLDKKVLISSAIAHDWGYIDMNLGRGATIGEVHEAKLKHMLVGAERIERLLKSKFAESLSKEQIARVKHLVYVHDRLSGIKDEDEVALVEADTLGALDVNRVKPTFTKADNEIYLKEQVMKLRRPLFRHPLAVRAYEPLYQQRLTFYD